MSRKQSFSVGLSLILAGVKINSAQQKRTQFGENFINQCVVEVSHGLTSLSAAVFRHGGSTDKNVLRSYVK